MRPLPLVVVVVAARAEPSRAKADSPPPLSLADLYHEMIETGVIQLENDKSKCALVFGQMNEPPGARARVALTGLTIAEYFRDEEGQDVLLFIDNIFRFTQGPSPSLPRRCRRTSPERRADLVPLLLPLAAGSEVSALLGRIPSAVGYQPTLSTDMGMMQERITCVLVSLVVFVLLPFLSSCC